MAAWAGGTQTLVPSTTVQSIGLASASGLVPVVPLSNDGSACLYVLQSGTTDTKLCSNFAAAMGGIAAPANTVLLNPFSGISLDAPQAIPSCPDTIGKLLIFTTNVGFTCPSGGVPPNAIVNANDSLAAGTTSATYVMVGMGANGGFSALITPDATGCIYASLSGGQLGGTATPQRVSYELRYGSGTPPVNGAAVTGTLIGTPQTISVPGGAGRAAIRAIGYVCGLALGTQYWFDAAIAAPSGGTAQIYALNMFMAER